jgi:hypothetical protein
MTDSPYVPGAGIALPREPFLLLPDFAASRRRTCSTRMSRNSTSSRSRAMSASAPTESMSAQYAPKTAHIVNRGVGVGDAPRIGSTRRLRSEVLSATERAYARSSIAPAPTRSTSSCYPSSGSTGARAAGRSGGCRLAGLVERLGASLPTEPPWEQDIWTTHARTGRLRPRRGDRAINIANASFDSLRHRYKTPNPACPIAVDGASLRMFGSENSTRLRPLFFAT